MNKEYHKLLTKSFITLLLLGSPILFFIHAKLFNMIISYITLIAIISALFREQIVHFFLTPKLELFISADKEDFHELKVTHDLGHTRMLEKQGWLGIKVKNTGLYKVKNVMVYFNGLKSNIVDDFESYNGISLVRSWTRESSIDYLPHGIGIRWDICYIRENSPKDISFSFASTPSNLHEIECEEDQIASFKFQIVATADNASTVRQDIQVKFKGKYKDGFTVKKNLVLKTPYKQDYARNEFRAAL